MSVRTRLLCALTTVALASPLVTLAPAAAAAPPVMTGAGTDASGDAGAGPDLKGFTVRHETAIGRVDATITLAAPAAQPPVAVYVGTWSGDTCNAAYIIRMGDAAGQSVLFNATATSQQVVGSSAVAGATISLSATAAFATAATSCAGAISLDNDFISPVDLSKEASENVDLQVRSEAYRLKKDKAGVVEVTVENTGRSPAYNTVVAPALPAGVTMAATDFGTIPAGAKVTKNVTVKATRTAKVQLTATALGGDSSIDWLYLEVVPKPPKATASLAGLSLFGLDASNIYVEGQPELLFFVNGKYAYRGAPKNGVPRCKKATATPEGDGCVRYWFNKQSGVIQVDAKRGRLKKGTWTIDGQRQFKLLTAKKGARFNVTLRHTGWFGCSGLPSCTLWQYDLKLSKNGSYAWRDQTGRYQVLSRSRIRFTPTTGVPWVRTLTLPTNKKGKADPAKEGLLLGAEYYIKR